MSLKSCLEKSTTSIEGVPKDTPSTVIYILVRYKQFLLLLRQCFAMHKGTILRLAISDLCNQSSSPVNLILSHKNNIVNQFSSPSNTTYRSTYMPDEQKYLTF